MLAGVLKHSWVGTADACAVIDALVRDLGMDMLVPLPKEEPPLVPFEPAWSPAELALHSPEVLHHMVAELGLSVNTRLEGAHGGTLLHRAISEMVTSPPPVAAAYVASLRVLLDAGADAGRFDKVEQTPLDFALASLTWHSEVFGPETPHHALYAAIEALLPKAEPPYMLAGILAEQLFKVSTAGHVGCC